MTLASDDATAFLRTYFSPDYNGITREEVKKSKELQRLIEPLFGEDPAPTVLPWRHPDRKGGRVDYWFALAGSASELYDCRAELKAFVGTTYAQIEGGRRRKSQDTPFAQALEQFTGGFVLPFTGSSGAVLKGVLQWLDVRAARPDRDIPETRSTGLLLRDLDAALQTRDRERARSILTFLRTDHRLGAHNLQFLEIKLEAAFQEWEDLLRHAQAKRLVQLRRRPAIVTDALLQAIYHVHLQEAARGGDMERLHTLLANLSGRLDTVWSRRTGLQSREAWLTYGLAAGLIENDYEGTEAARQAIAKQGGDANLLAHLLERLEPSAMPEDARMAFMQRDYDRALELARAMDDGPYRAGLLVLLSRELDTLHVRQKAWEAAEQLGEDEREALSTIERDALKRLADAMTPAEAKVSGWLELFRAVEAETLSHAQVLRLAQAGHAEWTLASLVSDPDALVDVLLSMPESQEATLQDIMNYVVDALQQDEAYPDPALREVYDILQLLLLDTQRPRPDTFYHAVDLIPGVVKGLNEGQYADRVEGVLDMLDRMSARIPPDRLLDFADLLVASACPDEGARQTVLTYIGQHRKKHERFWSRAHWRFLYDLAGEVGLAGLVPPLPPEDETGAAANPMKALEGHYIGIYTLTTSAGKRAAKLLKERVPSVDVKLNHAKVATDKLEAMAEHADVIVMVTSSATHAATDAIMQNLGSHTVLVRPPGKGSSSILSSLEEAAANFTSD